MLTVLYSLYTCEVSLMLKLGQKLIEI